MRNKLVLPLLAVVALTGAAARAQSTADSLTRMEAETLLLKAREKQLEVQASIVAKQADIASRQSLATAAPPPPVAGDPVIRAIEGVGGKLYASLQMSDGSVVDVQAGDVLPGGLTIVSISPREVVARSKDKQKIRLGTYAQLSSGFNPGYPGAALALPLPQAHGAAR
jgi:type IV pilus biogenesis protein PilP